LLKTNREEKKYIEKKEKKKKEKEGGFSSFRPLLSLKTMVHTH
jgi:hypothetical protein